MDCLTAHSDMIVNRFTAPDPPGRIGCSGSPRRSSRDCRESPTESLDVYCLKRGWAIMQGREAALSEAPIKQPIGCTCPTAPHNRRSRIVFHPGSDLFPFLVVDQTMPCVSCTTPVTYFSDARIPYVQTIALTTFHWPSIGAVQCSHAVFDLTPMLKSEAPLCRFCTCCGCNTTAPYPGLDLVRSIKADD